MNSKSLEFDLDKIQVKDPDELVKFAEYLLPYLRILARRYLTAISIHDADDFAQDALVKILSNIDKLKDIKENSHMVKYCSVIARNTYIDKMRHETVKNKYQFFSAETDMEIDVDSLPDYSMINELSKNELSDLISKSLEELSESEKQLFSYYIEGLNFSEISQKMGISPSIVANRLYRARSKIVHNVKGLFSEGGAK